MKRRITLLLALVLLISLAAPAAAFTNQKWTPADRAPFDVSIKLIDAVNGPMGISFREPAANRGYARNEIVCAAATLYVPGGKDVAKLDYKSLVFSGENVSLNVTDNASGNAIQLITSQNIPEASRVFSAGSGGLKASNEIRYDVSLLPTSSKDANYSFAFFAQVTGDDAHLNVLLTKDKAFRTPASGSTEANFIAVQNYGSGATHLRFNEEYHVFRYTDGDSVWYTVINADLTRALFRVSANKDGKSERMQIVLTGASAAEDKWYEVLETTGNRLFFREVNGTDFLYPGDPTMTDDMNYRYGLLTARYDKLVVGTFGLDYRYKGNLLREEYFSDYGNIDDVYAEVFVEPWYADVVVPPEINVYPPKTGGTSNAIGFLMLTLCAVSAVLVRRARAK